MYRSRILLVLGAAEAGALVLHQEGQPARGCTRYHARRGGQRPRLTLPHHHLQLGHAGAVAQARSQLDDPRVSARPARVARGQAIEHLLRQTADLLRLGLRGDDLLVPEKVCHQVAEQGAPVIGRPAQLAPVDSVGHSYSPGSSWISSFSLRCHSGTSSSSPSVAAAAFLARERLAGGAAASGAATAASSSTGGASGAAASSTAGRWAMMGLSPSSIGSASITSSRLSAGRGAPSLRLSPP